MRPGTLAFAIFILPFATGVAAAQTGSLEDRIKALEMKSGGSKASGDALTVSYEDGLWFRAANGAIEGRVGAFVLTHYTTHLHLREADGRIDGFTAKEAAIEFSARLWKAWEIYLRPLVEPGGTTLDYGWVEFNKWDFLRIRAGVDKEPFSPETLEDIRWGDLPEDSLMSLLTPDKDLGVRVFGDLLDGIFSYAVGVYNGSGLTNADNNSDKEVCGRLVVRPGATSTVEAIRHLAIGASVSRGRENIVDAEPFEFEALATGTTYQTVTSGAAAGLTGFEIDGHATRVGADLTWVWGPLSVKGEWISYKSQIEFGQDHENFRAHGYYGAVGFWLLGSTRENNHRPEIKKPLFAGGIGDVQVVVRASRVAIDDTFEERGLASGSRNVNEYAFGANWYPNSHVRISAMYVHYRYDQNSSRQLFTANGRKLDYENAIIIRAQIDF